MSKPDADLVMAQKIWTENRNGTGPCSEALLRIADQAKTAGDPVVSRLCRDSFFFSQAWADDGFVTLQSSHKYAAALMCTESRAASSDVILPWRAVRLAVPDGLLEKDDVSLNWIYLAKEHEWIDGEAMGKAMMIITHGRVLESFDLAADAVTIPTMVHRSSASLSNILLNEASAFAFEGPADRQLLSDRIITLAARYCVGMLYTLQHTDNFKERNIQSKGSGRRRRQGEPSHRVFFCGSPISVDARPQLREWLATGPRESSAPALQSLVRGHYKRQVIGASRSGRKVIWVEPYWRGPEDAPIMVRPYTIGAAVGRSSP